MPGPDKFSFDLSKLRGIYDTMRNKGYRESWEEFKGGMVGKDKYQVRKRIFDALKSNNDTSAKSYEEFVDGLRFVAPAKPKVAAAPKLDLPKPSSGGKPADGSEFFGKVMRGENVSGSEPIVPKRQDYGGFDKMMTADGRPLTGDATDTWERKLVRDHGKEAGLDDEQIRRIEDGLKVKNIVADMEQTKRDAAKIGRSEASSADLSADASYHDETSREADRRRRESGNYNTQVEFDRLKNNNPLIKTWKLSDHLSSVRNNDEEWLATGEKWYDENEGVFKSRVISNYGNEYVRSESVDEVIGRLKKESEELGRKVDERQLELYGGDKTKRTIADATATLTGQKLIFGMDPQLYHDDYGRSLAAAKRKIDERIETLEGHRDDPGFWAGVGERLSSRDWWTLGASDVADLSQDLVLKQKIENGEELSDADVAYLRSSMYADRDGQFYGKRGFLNRAGKLTADAIPFVAEFVFTGGGMNALQGATKLGMKAATQVGKNALKRAAAREAKELAADVTKDMTKGAAKKALGTRARMWLLKNTGVVADDLARAGVMANTVGAGRTAGDAIGRYVGSVGVDDEGKFVYEGGVSAGEALLKAEVGNTLEYYTEMLGNHLKIGDWVAKGTEKIGAGKLSKAIKWAGSNKWLEKGGIQDLPSEGLEEEANIVLNSMLVGDNKLSDLWDGETQADIWGGMALSVGFMRSVAAAHEGYVWSRYKMQERKVEMADVVAGYRFGDMADWSALKERIDGTTNEDMKGVVMSIMNDDGLHAEQKKAALDYVGSLMQLRGYNLGSVNDANDKEAAAKEAKENGDAVFVGAGEAETEKVEGDMEGGEAPAGPDAPTSNSETAALPSIDDGEQGGPVSAAFNRGREADAQERQDIAIELTDQSNVEAQEAWNGVVQRINEDADLMVAQQRAQTKEMQHKDGNVRPAILKEKDSEGNDQQVYIVDGNVEMMPDGSMVDKAASDNIVVVYNPATGERKQIDPTADDGISSLGEVTTAEQREADIERSRQAYVQAQIDEAQGTVRVVPGQQLVLPTGEEGVVVAIDADGEDITVALGDGRQATVQRSELQRFRDEKALADYRQRHGITEEPAAQQAEGYEPAQPQAEGRVAGAPADYTTDMELTIRDEDGSEKPAMVMGRVRYENGSFVPDENGKIIEYYMDGEVKHAHEDVLSRDVVGYVAPHQTEAAPVEEASAETPATVETTPPPIEQQAEVVPQPMQTEEPMPAQPAIHNADESNLDITSRERVKDTDPMPVREDGEEDWQATTPERAHAYIFNEAGLSRSEGNEFIAAQIQAAQSALMKASSANMPKVGTSIRKYNEAKAKRQEKIDEAQRVLDYWNSVREIQNAIARDENERRAAEDAARHEEAVAQVQAEYEARKRAEAERKAVGHENPMPAITDKWNNATKVDGHRDEIMLPDGTALKGHYVLHESGASSPSHNPVTWQKTEGFPMDVNGGSVNDRDYERDLDAQEHTQRIAREYDQRALQNVPVVSNDGVVLSGNGRTMAGELAARDNTDGAYVNYLKEYAPKFGFTAEQVGAMQHPRVSFVPDEAMPYTAETFAKFNQQEMKSQNKTEMAVKLGKTVSDDSFKGIVRTINGYETLGDFYNDADASLGAVYDLHNAGVVPQAQLAEMVDGVRGQEKLSAVGREFLENMLIGKAFEGAPDVVRMLTAEPLMRQTVITALGEIVDNIALGGGWSLQGELADAVKLCFDARQGGAKYGEIVSTYARQGVLFADPDELQTVADFNNATMLMLADVLNDKRVTLLKTTLQLYNNNARESASGQADMFAGGVRSREDILRDVINFINENYGKRKEIEAARSAAVERRKAEGVVAEDKPGGTRSITSKLGSTLVGTGIQQNGTPPAVGGGSDDTGGSGGNKTTVSAGLRITDPRTMSDEERQRRGEMLRNATAIPVAANHIVSTKDKTARKVAEEWWDDNVSDAKWYETEAGEVEINRNSVESSLAHGYGQMKLDAITSLVDGFSNAVYLGTMPDLTRQDGVLNHYFAYPINYNGKRSYVFCRALHDNNTNRLYVHEVFVEDKIKKGNTLQTAASQPHGGISLYRDILANVLLSDGKDKRVPYKNKPSILERWSVDGSTTISPAEVQQPADTENISALDQSISDGKESENPSTNQAKGEKVAENQSPSGVEVAVDAAERRVLEEEAKRTASHFPTETREEAAAFDRRVGEMSDLELLSFIKADGNGDVNKALHPSVYDEFDYRYGDEISAAYDWYLDSLLENGTTLEQAEDMLANIRRDKSLLATDRRAELLGQEDALQDYIVELKNREDQQVRQQKGSGIGNISPREAALRDALVDVKRGAGVEVVTDVEEGQRELDEVNGEARLQAMIGGLQKASDFIVSFLKGKTKQRSSKLEIPERANRLAERAIGHKIKSHTINANELTHSKKRHGINGSAITEKSIPLRDEDFALMPYIMSAPTRVVKGSTASNGTESVRYEKELPNGVVVVVEREGKFDIEEMENITMWAEKKSATNVTVAQRASHSTSGTIVISEADAAKIRKDAEDAIRRDEYLRFSRSNGVVGLKTPSPVFYSNAERAVMGISQKKATAEQWLAMIKKLGGIKAGEDKWLGLSDWLESRKGESVTKDEVLGFIRENRVEIEEVDYSADVDVKDNERMKDLQQEFEELMVEAEEATGSIYTSELADWAFERMVDRYGDDFDTAFYPEVENGEGRLVANRDYDGMLDEAARYFLGFEEGGEIHPTRLDYTTDGLEHKKEIAFTVPTIAPWHEEDAIHFGDAGGGRAVAWVRFGETTDGEGRRVLVIDEIQSNRHQEGREKGYVSSGDIEAARNALAERELAIRKRMSEIDARMRAIIAMIPDDVVGIVARSKYRRNMPENEEYLRLDDEREALSSELSRMRREVETMEKRLVPDAPFEKNWHEMVMKRMLRYAAEMGYDKVAWTKGAQQAERYELGRQVDEIRVWDNSDGVNTVVGIKDGQQVFSRDTQGGESGLAEVVGKDMARKAYSNLHEGGDGYMTGDGYVSLRGKDLSVGGVGMRGFYDEILPRFMDKYGKKWGVKTEDVELPKLLGSARVMHAVDVTDAMKESVMEGQPMFFRTKDGRAYGFVKDGRIYIDPRIATAETPIHEYCHLWASAMRELNPKEWRNIVELMKGTAVWDDVKRLYPELKTDDAIGEEVLAHYSGRRGAGRLRAEQEKILGGNGDVLEKAAALSAIGRVKEALKRFWKGVADWFGIHFTSAEEVADKVLSDLLNGVNPVSAMKSERGGVRYEANSEEAEIVAKAKADGTYMKAPNGNASKLSPRQWVQVRTRAFKEWFGDWEKRARIEKLRNSEPIVRKGDEYKGRYELNSRSAEDYVIHSLRGEYPNNDTGDVIRITRASRKVAHHDAENEVHLRSIAYIPEMIKNAVFIEERVNEKSGRFDSYRYYVVGLKIGGVDYTAKLVVGVKGGESYYDHSLTEIEKNNLIDLTDGVKADVSGNEAANFTGKDKRLLSILQTNSSKVVDENGEPRVVYHQTNSTIFVNRKTGENFDNLNWKEKDYWQNEASEEEWNDTWEERDFYVFDNKTHGRRSVEMPAFFFSPVYDEYHEYGDRTVAAFLNIRNPIVNPDIPNRGVTDTAGEDAMNALIAQGYDGFIREYDGELDEINAFFPNQIKSADENVGTFDGANPDIRYQFVGERGAAAMDKAEEAGVRLDNLAVAREMESAGKDAKAVKLATGWERGADGKWRYEIEDGSFDRSGELHPERRRLSSSEQKELDDAFFETMDAFEKGSLAYKEEITEDTDMADIYEAGGMERKKAERIRDLEDKEHRLKGEPKKLDDYLENDELFNAYPQLREIVIDTSSQGDAIFGKLGSYDLASNTIRLNDTSLSTLTHEVQHAIQEIEGFARGGSVRDVRKRIMKRISELDDVSEHAKEMLARQVEYRALASKLGYVYERLMKNGEDWAVRAASDNYWEAMNTLDNDENSTLENSYPKGKNASEIAKEGFNRGKAIEELKRLSDYYASQISAEDMKNIKASEALSGKIDGKSNKELYHALGGEVEARNVQARLGLSAEERRASLASETEDVAREDQLFLEDGLGVGASARMDAGATDVRSIAQRMDEERGTEVARFVDFLRRGKLGEGESRYFHVGDTGGLLNEYGISGKITVSSSAANSHHNKDKDHLSDTDWVDVFDKINEPIAITRYGDRPNSFRIYTIVEKNGKNICVGVDVNSVGRNVNITNIKTGFARDIANALNEELVYPRSRQELETAIQERSLRHNREVYPEQPYDAAKLAEKSEKQNAGMQKNEVDGMEDTAKYRIREDEPPTKTGIGYKVFVLKDGKLYPPMVANPNGEATPVGVWLDADAAPVAGVTKTGRQQVKAGGKGTQGGSGKLAYRPGWHLGEIPYALQFNRLNPETGEKELFPANFVWAEVEYANDVDYQEEAMSYGMNASGKFQHSLAGLPRLPENGSYRYRTNPNPETDPWVITGAMKVNRILKPSEVDAMVEAAGREPQQRQAGAVTDEQVDALNATVKRTMQEDRDMMRSAVEQMGEKLHTDINIIEDVNEITHPNAAVQERRRKSKGWYDTATGQVNIVLDNNRDVDDVKASVGHETIAHKGLRELVGEENYDEFLDEVYGHLRDDLKQGVDAAAGRAFVDDATKNGKRAKSYEQHRRTAVDELFGRLAEKPFEEFTEGERTLWQKLKAAVRKLLDKFLGSLKLPKWFELGDNELRYILWRSKERLERGREHPIDLARDIVKREELGLKDEARYNMGDAPETFKSRQKRAVENKGTVMPGLNGAQVKVVDVPRHHYTGNIAEATRQAIEAAKTKFAPNGKARTLRYDNFGATFDYSISGSAVEESLNPKQQAKSVNKGVHIAMAEHLDEIIGQSIEVEEHPDYLKNEKGERDTSIINDKALMHRFYGAVVVDGVPYRVMTLMREEKNPIVGNGIHAYEVQKIEVLDETPNTPNGVGSHPQSEIGSSYPLAKLLQNVGKSYEKDKNLLDDSKLADESTDLYREGDDVSPDGATSPSPQQNSRTRGSAFGSDDIWTDGSMGLQERMTAAATRLANNHREDKTLRNDAMRAIGGNLADLRKAMSLQRTFDRTTVKRVADLARVLITNGYINNATSGEIKRLLSAVKNSVGHNDIEGDVQKVMDIMVDNQLKHAEETLHELEAIKGSKVDARGVEVQGQLDAEGQTLIKAMKEAQKIVNPCGGKTHDENGEPTAWGNALESAIMRMSSNDQAVADAAAIEYAGMQMAQQWFDTIQQSKLEEQELRQELKSGYVDDSGNPIDDPQGKREWRASIEEAIRQNKIERVQAYYELVGRLTDSLRESLANAKDFKEAEQQRIREIQHNANSDMEGRPDEEHQMPANTRKKINNWMGNSLFAPLATYMEMLRLFGRKSANGEGYLFNRFGRGWIDARQQEIRGVRDKYAILDAKAKELFGGQVKTWGDLIRRVGKLPKGTVSFWNGGEMQECEMTQGNLMYIYMVNKMLDGRMKLRKMGISEEDVAEIERVLDPRLIELADWLQDEFLVQTRNEYNETHKRMFGASMAAIEHYFPLRVLKNAIDVKAEDLDKPEVTDGISTITGGIIKRRRNSKPLDILNADALHVILSHVAEMEHWNAYAEFNRDLNTLRSYRHFRNQVQNMNTIYGNGKNLWKKFNDVCQMATGAYKPKGDGIEKAILSAAQGVTAAKVAFRIFTALKQFASLPAYFPYVRADYLVKSMARPDVSWSWCMEHLPIFEERWKSRVSGDPRLAKSILTAADWRQNLAVKVARAGMAPNAFVDALTVSMGAYAVYQTRKGQYLRDGYSEEQAERRAIQDTEMVYNETQQSGESAFTSTMQTDRTWWKVMFSVFRNSSMAYQRQLHGALRDLGNMIKEGGVSERLAFMKKQMIRDGLSEEQADAASKRRLRRQFVKDGLAVATFGYIMQLAWNMTGYLPYLLFGDDDETKDEFWDDIWAHTMGGWLEGLTGGDVMSLGIGMWRNGEVSEWKLKKEMPLTTDLFKTGRELFKGEYSAFVTDAVNLCVQMGLGVNPQSITDGVLAIMDACGDDPALAHEATICISRILQVPQSQIDKMYFDEVGLSGDEVSKYTPAQLAERYAEFKVKRGRFFSPWSWDDEDQIGKFTEKANKTINERTEQMGDKKVNEAYLRYEEVYKGVDAKVNEAKKKAKTDYVEAAQLMAEARSDSKAFETYQMFKPMDGYFNEIVKLYLGAKTPDEAALCRQAVLDYKSAMVKVLEAPDVSTRAEAIDSLRAVMQDFDDAQSRLRSAE